MDDAAPASPRGPDPLARAIVAEAVEIERRRRDLKPLEVLDLVMRGRRGTAPDFGALDAPGGTHLLDPTSPFGALLAAAFDEQVTFSGLRKVSAENSPPSSFERFWLDRVLRAFRERYRLALPPA